MLPRRWTCRWRDFRARRQVSDDFARVQIRDRFRAIAERGQHFVGMGAEFGRHRIEPAAAMGELKTAAGKAQAAIGVSIS
jgi:hypothetical protein